MVGCAVKHWVKPHASDPAKFYLLTSAGQITATFQTTGTNLTKRVTQ